MQLPGSGPQLSPVEAIEKVYDALGQANNVLTGISAAISQPLVQTTAEATGVIAGVEQSLINRVGEATGNAQQVIDGIHRELTTTALGQMVEPHRVIENLVPFLPEPEQPTPAPAVPPVGGGSRSMIPGLRPPVAPACPPGSTPVTTPTGTQCVPTPPPPPAPQPIPPEQPTCSPSSIGSVPWGNGPFNVYQNLAYDANVPGSFAYVVLSAATAVAPPSYLLVNASVAESDLPGIVFALTGCIVAPPAVPTPEPTPVPQPAPLPPGGPPGVPVPPPAPPIPEPEPLPPGPAPLPPGCGNVIPELPDCWTWGYCVGADSWDIWVDPATCTLYKVPCNCDPNAGCPRGNWTKLGSATFVPKAQCGAIPLGPATPTPVPQPPAPGPAPAPPEPKPLPPPPQPAPEPQPPDASGYPDLNRLDVCRQYANWEVEPEVPWELRVAFDSGLVDGQGHDTVPEWCRSLSRTLLIASVSNITSLAYGLRQLLPLVGGGAVASEFEAFLNGLTGDKNTDTLAIQIAKISRTFLAALNLWHKAYVENTSPKFRFCVWQWSIIQLISLAEGWLHVDFSIAKQYLQYWINYEVQQFIPSPNEADAAYLNGTVDYQTWECWQKLAGRHVTPARAVMEAGRAKPNAADVVQLDMREILPPDSLTEYRRRAGYLRDEDYLAMKALAQQIPPASDLVRFMARDAADQGLVDKLGMDVDFDKKFAGKLKVWARQQGVDENYMRFNWRSHWRIPSPTQLYQMIHRFRHLDPKDKLYTDKETARQALEQDDVLPFWIDRLLEISYLPINRTTALQAFVIDALPEQKLREVTWAEGYNDDDTEILMELARRQKARRKADEQSLPTVATAIRYYKRGSISRAVAEEWIRRRGYQDKDAKTAMDAADEEIQAERLDRQIAAVRERFRHGEYTMAQAVEELVGINVQLDNANRLVDQWEDEIKIKGRYITAYRLCRYVKQGLITLDDMWNRLVRLGYTTKDADILVGGCKRDIELALAKAAAAAARAAGKPKVKPKR